MKKLLLIAGFIISGATFLSAASGDKTVVGPFNGFGIYSGATKVKAGKPVDTLYGNVFGFATQPHFSSYSTHRQAEINGKQATLVSGTNIKTINGTTVLGSGDIAIPAYTLPTATSTVLGGVKPDGTSILNMAGVISATASSVGADVSGAASTVNTALTTHTGLTGTAVHGLGTMSTATETNYALLAGRAGGQTLIGGSAVTDKLVLQGTSGNGTLTSPAIQLNVGNNGATNAVTVLNNGNVGFGGSTAPVSKLVVGATPGLSTKLLTVSDLTSPYSQSAANGIAVSLSTGGGIYMNYGGSGGVDGKYEVLSSELGIGTMSNHDVSLYSNNTARITLTKAGVLKFLSNNPLTIFNSDGSQSIFWLKTDNSASSTRTKTGIAATGDGSYGISDLSFLLNNANDNTSATIAGNTRVIFKADGTVGINTLTPSARLDVHGTGTTTGNLVQFSDSGGNAKVTVLDSGATTFVNQITSTVATGTAPLVVASTTAVSNLNADLLDGQHGSYYQTALGYTPMKTDYSNAGTAPTWNQNTSGYASKVLGTTTNDNAAAGYVGEYVENVVGYGSRTSLTTGTAKDVTNITLGAGDWDVTGMVKFDFAATTSVTRIIGTTTLVSGTLPSDDAPSADRFFPSTGQINTGWDSESIIIPMRRFSLTTNTTVYLDAWAGFTVSTANAYGYIRARRIR